MVDFRLREMEPTDGPAIDALMRHEAQTTSMGMTTLYRHDIYRALLAQHPALFGVVAESPGMDGLVGVATAFLAEVTIGGRIYPSAHLENLKVRHDVRRHGLGGRLAAWRIDEAHRRFGGEGVVAAGIESSNSASLATARRWATQTLGPVRIVIGRTTSKRATSRGIEVRPVAADDVEALVDQLNLFYATYDMFPPQTATAFTAALEPTSIGEPIRAYRVAVARDGTLLAGMGITERFKLMTDHINSVPLPIAILGRLTGLLPRDRLIRSIEVALAWHTPGRVDAARAVWDSIRFEWRDRANFIGGIADPRGSLIDAFHVGVSIAPRLELVTPVQSPVPLDEDRLLYMWR